MLKSSHPLGDAMWCAMGSGYGSRISSTKWGGTKINGASLAPFHANGALPSHISEGLRTQPRIGGPCIFDLLQWAQNVGEHQQK